MTFSFFDLMTLAGSLGLFLYGMKVMSDTLLDLAGDRMRAILATATSNRFLAVSTGFAITAVIQSSSATTLMVVSFANASLLTLGEAIGVIMGANIGTTVTAWLISILGFKVSMSAVAIPLVGVGFLMSLSKRKNLKNWGRFIIGFSILFIGLQFLKDSVPDLNQHPETFAFLSSYTDKGYLSVLLFLAIGTLLTVILQSSSATMALTLIMCFEGWIPFQMAAAMVLGENIGTTITANLAAWIGNHHAKRAARAHLIFNLIGVAWMLLLFWFFLDLIDAVVQRIESASPFVQTSAVPVALSLFHTSFNIINTSLLLGFIGLITRIVTWLVPAVPEKAVKIEHPYYLDDSSLRFPQTAFKALADESIRLYEKTAYKVITHGLLVHREKFETDEDLKKILRDIDLIEIDIDKIYYEKIKIIYGHIVAFATTLQGKFDLDDERIKRIRNILRADRLVVAVVKDIKALHINLTRYLRSDNAYIQTEYNRLRRLILRVLRQTRRIEKEARDEAQRQQAHLELLDQIDQHDVLLNGTIDQLIRDGKISNEMATSLMNDSSLAIDISRNLVEIASILYRSGQPQEKTEVESGETSNTTLSDDLGVLEKSGDEKVNSELEKLKSEG